METIKDDNLPNTSSVYGRNLTEDLERMAQDLDLQRAGAVFSRYPKVKSIGHLAEILKITRTDSADRLECLQNLNIIKYEEGSYVANVDGFHLEGKMGSKKERQKKHTNRLIQVASLLKSSDEFSDLSLTECTSKDIAITLQNDILKSFERFRASTAKLKTEDKKVLLSLVLGYTKDEIELEKGGLND